MTDPNSSMDMFGEESFSEEIDWRGSPLEELKPKNICTYPSIRSTANHIVLFKLPIPLEGHLEPHPSRPADKWDVDHVRMPHSPESLYPISQNELKSRWEIIVETYSKPITSSKELETAILAYNPQPNGKVTFNAIHQFFSETLRKEETSYFFQTILPNIVKLALEIEDKFRGGVPILKRGSNKSISMTQVQAGVLLANAFLCTFPRRNPTSQQSALPSINFYKFFQCGSLDRVQQKLKCFTNYFRRILKKRPSGVITYTRRHVRPSELPRWSESETKFSRLHVSSSGTIEESGSGMMEIDFANKLVGGGVLGRGSVQEEIRFLICPELVVARLFCESLEDTEAVIVTGCERFNTYEGYGSSFTWSGNYDDSDRPRDAYRRLNTVVVAIDALNYVRSIDQFKLNIITRELNKAYAGFSFGQDGAIATGNWGCGVYKGDPLLKFLLQLMAASECKKPLAYFTFGSEELRNKLFEMHHFLISKDITVGMLWNVIKAYSTSEIQEKCGKSLYDYIYCSLDANSDNRHEGRPREHVEEMSNGNKYKRKYEAREANSNNENLNFKKSNGSELPAESSLPHSDDDCAHSPESKTKRESDVCKSYFRSSCSSKTCEPSGTDPPKISTSPPGMDNLVIAPRKVVTKNETVNGIVTKKLSLKLDKSDKSFPSLNESIDETFSKDVSCRRGSVEPVDAETCSLRTEEGRRKCLESDQERWGAYQTAMSKFGNETRIDDTSPDSPQSLPKSKPGPVKRKISDYFPSASPR